ncbi:MAG: cytidylate kinase-like family protein [Prolixibacteraceae bacterium]|nr:cytidylate kinase-like family protein [Prolixibacteraceae bacterium]
MSDILYNYMSKRFGEPDLNDLKTKPGPVVTISRMAGCSSQRLAKDLAARLNQIHNTGHWNVISKEVLHESAEKLQLDPKKIKTVFKVHDRSVLNDIVQAFLSQDYHLEKRMRNTVINVIRRFSVEGHKIILGRGANIICSDLELAFHIRIVAPLEWRVKKVMTTKKYTREEALHCIEKTEKDRFTFRNSMKGKTVEVDDFDLTINQSRFSNDEIIELIVTGMKMKKMIE